MVDRLLSFLKGTGPEEGWISIALSGALERESFDVPTVVSCVKLAYDAGKDLAVLLKPHVPVQKRDTEQRCAGELAKVQVVCNCAFAGWFNMRLWLKDAESPLPQMKTQHVLERTELNRSTGTLNKQTVVSNWYST